MDILDIDEVLKDDSFILLEDRNHDDVTNILQQWKISNQQNQEVPGNSSHLNTRTFTRPKRRGIQQNLENHFNINQMPTQLNNINMQIGGLVTSMQKSFLSDTSPPASICSLMDGSVDGMNNSLITSADFSNVSFFQTSVDDKMSSNNCEFNTDTGLRYTLNDVIRDRKALDDLTDLTISGDNSTLKDLNIAQIDDISLVSKTASGYSTMSSSAESSSGGINDTMQPLNITNTIETNNFTFNASSDKDIIQNNCKNDNILNSTFNFHNSFQSINDNNIMSTTIDIKSSPNNETQDIVVDNNTFNKHIHEPISIGKDSPNLNQTSDLHDKVLDGSTCGTPENSSLKETRYQQSTPLHTNNIRGTNSFTPTIKSAVNEVTISPIISVNKITDDQSMLNSTYELLNETNVKNRTFDKNELKLKFETIQIDDLDLEELNVNKEAYIHKKPEDGETVENDDDDFDKILDNIVTFKPTEESIKIQKSVESIKKRYSMAAEKLEPGENAEVNSPNVMTMSKSLTQSGNSGGNRLLSLRTRLYDDIDINKSINDLKTSQNEKQSSKFDESIKESASNVNEKTDITQPEEIVNKSENVDNLKPKVDRRDRDRFKTIRIIKRSNENLSIPCIDDDETVNINEPNNDPIVEATNYYSPKSTQRFSRIDNNLTNVNVFNNNKTEMDKPANIYNTYKKPKELYATSAKAQQQNNILQKHQRSLSRPRYISGLQTFRREIPTKAMSADDLDVKESETMKIKGNIKQPLPAVPPTLKSPMGTKAKSFHNLSNNFTSTNHSKLPATAVSSKKMVTNKSDLNVFKSPHPVSALRPPSAVKRVGLIRPSSGYYSLNTAPGSESNDLELEHNSPVESLSSASSRSSLAVGQLQLPSGTETMVSKQSTMQSSSGLKKPVSAGIPKPSGLSGLRPPSRLPKSGLPRPSSMIRR